MTIKVLQTNFTSGVLDPKLAAREDITFFYNALKSGLNALVMPQGGVTARPGMQIVRELKSVLSEVSLSGATVSAPQGGTAGNGYDGDAETKVTTSGNIGVVNPFVVFHVDFTLPVAVDAVDVLDYSLSSGSLVGEFFVQYSSDDSAWENYDGSFDWDIGLRSRRRSVGDPVTARYWRIVRSGSTATAATASIGEVKFWAAGADLSNVRLVPFAYSTNEAYMMVATGGNIDILIGREYQGSIGISHSSAQLPTINWTQSLDTLILFHKNVAPSKIFRQGDDDEFDFRLVGFSNIPNHDYGAGVGGINEVQVLNDGGTVASGDDFTILLEGKRTTTIIAGGSRAATATAIETALRALANTSSDGIVVADASGSGFTVTFGGDDGLQAWDEMSVSVLTGNSVWSISRTTEGEGPGEPIMSDTRGWPRCGLFHQSRLHLGGIEGVPDAILMSALAEYYNFDVKRDDDTKGLLFRAETDQVGAIYNIVAGRHLSLFTNDGEFFFSGEAITAESAPRLTTRSGSKEGMRIHEVDGALLFVQGVKDDESDREVATSVREFLFVDTEQSYKAGLISKLSSHLIKNPIDVALRKALSTDEADILLLINDEGDGTAYTVLRDDAVNAFMPISTRAGDKLLAVGVDKKRRVYFATERNIGGVLKRFVEIWNSDLLLDCGDIITMVYENVLAVSSLQSDFLWSFTSPGSASEIGVRINGARLESDDYIVDLGAKKITLVAELADGIAVGDIIRISIMEDSVSGLDHLEGEVLKTVIDGSEGDEFTVSGGVLNLSSYADTEIQYGFSFDVFGELMPLRIPNGETLSGDKVRVVNAIFQLHQTGGLDVKANGGDWQNLPLLKTDDDVLDRSTSELLFTGEIEIQGLTGYEIGAPLSFRRSGPVPFTVLGITREVSL